MRSFGRAFLIGLAIMVGLVIAFAAFGPLFMWGS